MVRRDRERYRNRQFRGKDQQEHKECSVPELVKASSEDRGAQGHLLSVSPHSLLSPSKRNTEKKARATR